MSILGPSYPIYSIINSTGAFQSALVSFKDLYSNSIINRAPQTLISGYLHQYKPYKAAIGAIVSSASYPIKYLLDTTLLDSLQWLYGSQIPSSRSFDAHRKRGRLSSDGENAIQCAFSKPEGARPGDGFLEFPVRGAFYD